MKHVAYGLWLGTFLVGSVLAQDIPIDDPVIKTGQQNAQARYIPWSGQWWELDEGNLAMGWNGKKCYTYDKEKDLFTLDTSIAANDLSPMAKYDAWHKAKYGSDPGAAMSELRGDHYVHGKRKEEYDKEGIDYSWWGHCNGWAAACIMEREPNQSVASKGIRFEVADLKGLLTELYYGTESYFTGKRVNKSPDEAKDAFEKAETFLKALSENKPPEVEEFKKWYKKAFDYELSGDTVSPTSMESYLKRYVAWYKNTYEVAFKDINPDVFHRIITTIIGKKRSALVFDVNADEAVWNFPAYSYEMTITADGTQEDSGQTLNAFNVKTKVTYATDGVSESVIGIRTFTRTYTYKLLCTSTGKMVKGEWTGGSVTDHPDFAWLPTHNPLGPDYEENSNLEFGKFLRILPSVHGMTQKSAIQLQVKKETGWVNSDSLRKDSPVTYGMAPTTGKTVDIRTSCMTAQAKTTVAKVMYYEQKVDSLGGGAIEATRDELVLLGESAEKTKDFAKTLTFDTTGKKMIVVQAFSVQGRLVAIDELTVKIQ